VIVAPIAHAGRWFEGLLCLAPLVIVILLLARVARRAGGGG
jgi:hypothetical protein